MSTSGTPIDLRVSLWDSGCLPALLTREIAAVERHVAVVGARLSDDARAQTDAYLGQLRGCLAAVEHARGARSP